MADLFNTALSGLRAFRVALDTTSHNIANVNTPGYSRQRVELSTQTPQRTGGSYLGSGVAVDAVSRVYDRFLTDQVRGLTSGQSQEAALHALASQIDRMLADPNVGVAPALADFFGALQDLAADPSSVPARDLVLQSGQALASRFDDLGSQFDALGGAANDRLTDAVAAANDLADQIADLNREIFAAHTSSGEPNDLLDQRDELLRQLSRYTRVTVADNGDGTLNVLVGTGQPVVVGTRAQRLDMVGDPHDPQRLRVGLATTAGPMDITGQLEGGEIAGILAFRDQVLDPARNQLGQLALGIAHTFNAQHQLGQDLEGDPGGAFFSVVDPRVLPRIGNVGDAAVAAAVVDVAGLTASDYRMARTGSDYALTRLSDGAVIDLDALGFPGTAVTVDGLRLEVASGTMADGDSFVIQPTRAAATGLAVAISRPQDIAAAAPIRTAAATGNIGTAVIDAGAVDHSGQPPLDANLTAPVSITFNVPPTTFNVTGAGTGDPVNLPYTSGEPIRFNGWTVAISGNPAAGDRFTVAANQGGVGDNRNVLALAQLQDAKTLAQGSQNYAEVYGSLVATVGARTARAQSANAAQETLLNQAVAARDSVAGVNLDEEAASLLRFQQAYQAAAQAIQIAGTLFDSLLAAVRR